MRNFLVFLVVCYTLIDYCFSQKWDINIKFRFDSLGKYNYNNNYLQNTGEHDRTRRNSAFWEFSCTRYIGIKNKYNRINVGMNTTLYQQATKDLINNQIVGMTENYRKRNSYYINLEHGLFFHWRRFNILLGGGVLYNYSGKQNMYKQQERYVVNNIENTYNGFKVVQYYLPAHTLGLYNGNSMYYTLFKRFYIGIDVRNSINYKFYNNIGKSITYTLDKFHNATPQSYSNLIIHEKRIYTSLVHTLFSIGFNW